MPDQRSRPAGKFDLADEFALDDLFDTDYILSEPDFSDLDFSGDDGDPPELLLDVPYVPSDDRTIRAMLDLAKVRGDDILYDLGCGDGRIVVTAALERGTRGIGIDLDPARIADAMELAGNSMVEDITDFIEGDLLEADFSDATVVMLYLLDMINLELRPRLLNELRPGTRIVSHAFDMADWKPDRHLRLGHVNLYKWLVPAPVAGSWQWPSRDGRQFRVALKQKFQQVRGQAWIDGEEARLHRARLRGDLVELSIRPAHDDENYSFVMRWKQDGQLHPEGKHGQVDAAVRC